MALKDITDISHIQGNASDEIKRVLGYPSAFFYAARTEDFNQPLFGDAIVDRLVCTEISLYAKPEEPRKVEAKVVIETTVEEDMLNGGGKIHGGCSALLIDMCSTLALTALSMNANGESIMSVSQALNVVYHSPAGLGDRLRLVNTTLTFGARAHSARTEIWNLTHHRLVASGTHIKMQPSAPPKPSL
ncbi:hypothetical protein P691DRAFT_728616 [Macrolepiota fuliginosa MF-IS2]|uniref:Thioesterase domain-containing protein n=1 Tax=Macrolepiota fuliginosa MF-IS2 TaxID=1400762 RepID=A0A9P5XGE1_9AGAR|nr:hypothetical protein P691DRAFT_728616 [Macrolepiota fuliginosa MF-IS2]